MTITYLFDSKIYDYEPSVNIHLFQIGSLPYIKITSPKNVFLMIDIYKSNCLFLSKTKSQ